MATEIIYKVTYNGYFLNPQGTRIVNGDRGAAEFSSLTDVDLFVEASGSEDGTYFIHTCASKVTPLPSGSEE